MDVMSHFNPEGMGDRATWMPDPGVYYYVSDLCREFGLSPEQFPEHWLPLCITGTMDWLAICGWWVWTYTGVFDTDSPYKWVFRYDGEYEFDPDKLLMFEENEELNAFDDRVFNAGLTPKERAEAFPFLLKDVYDAWDMSRPPPEIVEIGLWGTLCWVLSEYGRAWLNEKDPIFEHVAQFAAAYLSRWDNKQLHPSKMERTERQLGTCANCELDLWCVRGYSVDRGWFFLCNACAVVLDQETDLELDSHDQRLSNPQCGSTTCTLTSCPHLGKTREDFIDEMFEAGKKRTEQYREWVAREFGGVNPRKAMGQTVRSMNDFFRQAMNPELGDSDE